MSHWTHVTLTAEVYHPEWTSPEELKAQVTEELGWKDRITGSEGSADVFVIPLNSTSVEYEGSKTFHYWNTALVVVHGHLRDREKEETEKEVQEFIEYNLKKHFCVIRDLDYNVWTDEEEPHWFSA